MLFKKEILGGIATGDVTLAFRRWKRPTVKQGGELKTAAGLLRIKTVDLVEENSITNSAARKAGYESVEDLKDTLQPDGALYRIEFQRIGADPRIALRENDNLTEGDISEIQTRLERFDARSQVGAWTKMVLQLIAKYPELRAAELAARSQFDKEWLKTNIRKLKNLGLTESLDVGYKLSPRGQAFLTASETE